jgi:hypothetical protein
VRGRETRAQQGLSIDGAGTSDNSLHKQPLSIENLQSPGAGDREGWTTVCRARYTYRMSHTISAVYDSGVFRPLQPVHLAEGTRAEVIPLDRPAPDSADVAGLATWPIGYFEQTAGALSDEEFERPPQGNLPQRDSW